MTLLIGIDLGTAGCKAAVYDESGVPPLKSRRGAVLRSEAHLDLGRPITLSSTMIEQDPEVWWDALCRTIDLALDAAEAGRREGMGLRSRVSAIAVSSQGISFVCLDEKGRPLGNAISWLDNRAAAECKTIQARYDDAALFAITGKRAAPFYLLPKLLWLREHRPDTWARTRSVLMGHDYLVHRLCGARITDHSMAGGTLLYDLRALNWSAALLSAFEIPRTWLPELRWSGTAVGPLLPEVARALGLSPDVVIVTGGQDQKCAALGAGIRDGVATLSLGTASAIVEGMDAPLTDPKMRIPTFTFVQRGRWVLEGVIATGAGSLRWHRDTLAPGTSYSTLDGEATAIPRGAEGVRFYPHLSGATSPHWQPEARAAFQGLSLASTRAHMTRALLEGVAYEMRTNLEITQTLAGPVKEAIVFGGGAKSALWRAIIGDVLNLPLAWSPNVETASLGAAMLAGVGCGLFATLDSARDQMLPLTQRREPDSRAAAEYEGLYADYRAGEARLLRKDHWPGLP
jgi:xylulokinase